MPVVRDKLGDLVREGRLDDPVEALLKFHAEWSTQRIDVQTGFLMHAFANNVRITRYHEVVATIGRKEGARPVQGGRAPGTRKARSKRKHGRGRR